MIVTWARKDKRPTSAEMPSASQKLLIVKPSSSGQINRSTSAPTIIAMMTQMADTTKIAVFRQKAGAKNKTQKAKTTTTKA